MQTSYLYNFVYQFRLIAVALVLWLVPFSALGFFSSVQTAPEQNFHAGTLALESVAPHPASLVVTSDDIASTTVDIQTVAGSIPAHYDVTVQHTDGKNNGFCEALSLRTTDPDGLVHTSDDVAEYHSGTQSAFGTWELAFSTDYASMAGNGATCTVTFLIDAWNEQVGKGGGFVDDKSFSIEVRFATAKDDEEEEKVEQENGEEVLPTVVLNEIYASPNSASSSPYNKEWVELYNMGTEPVDVLSWIITEEISSGDNAGTQRPHEVFADCEDGPGVSVSMEPVVGTSTIVAPQDFLLLQYCGTAPYMSVDGDTVRLYQVGDYDRFVGQYGTSTAPATDEFTYSSTVTGKALARVPDGDGQWKKQDPTPNTTNILDDPEQTQGIFGIMGAAVDDDSKKDGRDNRGSNEDGDAKREEEERKDEDEVVREPSDETGGESSKDDGDKADKQDGADKESENDSDSKRDKEESSESDGDAVPKGEEHTEEANRDENDDTQSDADPDVTDEGDADDEKDDEKQDEEEKDDVVEDDKEENDEEEETNGQQGSGNDGDTTIDDSDTGEPDYDIDDPDSSNGTYNVDDEDGDDEEE